MSYLISQDYIMQIQPQLRGQINALAMSKAELTAMEEINGYVSKKYLTTQEFTDTTLYNNSVIYSAYNRVYLNYTAFNPATNYTVGQYVTYNYVSYICVVAGVNAWNLANWQQVSNIYFAVYPQPLFNIYGHYKIGDKVFWKNHIYTSLQYTKQLSSVQMLQYGETDNLPLNNVFPDDPCNGKTWWTDNGAYMVPAGTLNPPTYDATLNYVPGQYVTYNGSVYVCAFYTSVPAGAFYPPWWTLVTTQYWQIGDNRSQLMVTHMINIALYWAHYSIAPNNVPDDRRDAYGIAKEWCKGVMRGDIVTPLPVIQPKRGQHIMSDSNVKRGNYY